MRKNALNCNVRSNSYWKDAIPRTGPLLVRGCGQMTTLTIEGKTYQISFVCKPTECGEHKFVVLFDATGEHAYGALGGKDNEPAFFGSPTQAEQDAMVKAVKD